MNIVKAILFVGILVCGLPLFASQIEYQPPRSANLELEVIEQTGSIMTFEARFKVLFGEIKNLKCYFEATDGIKIDPVSAQITSIKEGEYLKFSFLATISESAKAVDEPWIRFRVNYLPDYDKLIDYVSSNKEEYPDDFARSWLVDSLLNVSKDNYRASDNIRYFIK